LNVHSKKADSSDSDLVRLALAGVEKDRVGDVASNPAAAQLRDRGPCVLPAIEDVVGSVTASATSDDITSVRFHGLSSVLVSYFEIAKESAIERAAEFVKSLSPEAQHEALTAIWSIWLGRTRRERIPSTLLSSIEEIASAGTEVHNQQASSLLRTHTKYFGTR
jgi:hypothetical protein